jgi:hypothetical protein
MEVVQLSVVRGIGPGFLSAEGLDGFGERTQKAAAIFEALRQGEAHDPALASFEHPFAA